MRRCKVGELREPDFGLDEALDWDLIERAYGVRRPSERDIDPRWQTARYLAAAYGVDERYIFEALEAEARNEQSGSA